MSQDSRPTPALFTQVDITAGAQVNRAASGDAAAEEHTGLLKNILAAQHRQNELLEELVNQMSGAQKQRDQKMKKKKKD